MKKIMHLMALVLCATLCACSSDEPENSDGSSSNSSSVTIKADGTTSTGVVFSPVDDTTFFLDYIKYQIVDSHLEIVGYDPIEIAENVKPYASVTYLGVTYSTRVVAESAFQKGTNIKSVFLPTGLKTIGASAFYGCTDLTSVTFPNGLESIGGDAFNGCTGLTSVTSLATNPPSCHCYHSHSQFSTETYNNATLNVPTTSVDLYKKSSDWRNFVNIQGI